MAGYNQKSKTVKSCLETAQVVLTSVKQWTMADSWPTHMVKDLAVCCHKSSATKAILLSWASWPLVHMASGPVRLPLAHNT